MFSRIRRPFVLVSASALMVLAQIVSAVPAGAGGNGPSNVQSLVYVGSFTPAGQSAGTPSSTSIDEIPPHQDMSKTLRHTASAGIPSVGGNSVTTGELTGFAGWNGISHHDQRFAGAGSYANTQFSLEPPDQGLCVGGGKVVEAVNNALEIYDTNGNSLTPAIALSQFFGFAPEVNRNVVPVVFGPFISDPKCYYDPDTARWFLTELEIAINPSTGAFGSQSHQVVAVSQSSDPTAAWSIYELDTTNDGTNGTPADTGCPCFGDQPLIGADANGFYVTTNEYTLSTFAYNGAQVYAFSKTGLENGSNSSAVHIFAGPMTSSIGGLAYTIQPATAPAANYETANDGTEYFLSGLDFTTAPALGIRATSLAVWALTNTASLSSTSPAVALSYVVINSNLYAQPPNATQKKGPLILGTAVHNPEELVDTNDDRMNQVVYADGKLWAAENTAVKTPNGPSLSGIAYFVVTPSSASGTLSATMTAQGYVAVDKEDVMFPSIGVTDAGKAVMAFSLVGPDYFPSAAYTTIDPVTGAGPIYVAAAGTGPDDGFTGYKAFGGKGSGRWGDYSAAVADASGNVWLSAEFIPNTPRSYYANWGTFVTHVTP